MDAALDILALVAVVGLRRRRRSPPGLVRAARARRGRHRAVVRAARARDPPHPRPRPHRTAAAAALRRRDPHVARRLPGQPPRHPAAVGRAGRLLDRRRSASSRGGSCRGSPLAAGFALGAVVAPPDAVAATTVARRVGMPRRIVSILEGESLVNDATALVALNTAIAAITASVTRLARRRGTSSAPPAAACWSGWSPPSCWRWSASTSTTRCSTPRCRSSRRSWPSCRPRRSTRPACSRSWSPA